MFIKEFIPSFAAVGHFFYEIMLASCFGKETKAHIFSDSIIDQKALKWLKVDNVEFVFHQEKLKEEVVSENSSYKNLVGFGKNPEHWQLGLEYYNYIEPFNRKKEVFSFTEEGKIQRDKLLQDLGVDLNKPVVVVHSRGTKFGGDMLAHVVRCYSFESLIPTVKYLIEKGYQVIRIGDPLSHEADLLDLEGFFDLSSNLNFGLCSVAAISRCKFFIVGNSGIFHVAHAFNKPVCMINQPSAIFNMLKNEDWVMFKKVKYKEKMLSLQAWFDLLLNWQYPKVLDGKGVRKIYDILHCIAEDITIEDNSSEEILAMVKFFLESVINKKEIKNEKTFILNKSYRDFQEKLSEKLQLKNIEEGDSLARRHAGQIEGVLKHADNVNIFDPKNFPEYYREEQIIEENKNIHALIHVHGCLPMLLPLLKKIRDNGRYALSVTVCYESNLPQVIYKDRDVDILRGERINVDESFASFERFLAAKGKKLLLTAADHAGGHHKLAGDCIVRARLYGIKSLSVQHGGNSTGYWEQKVKPEYVFISDKMALWGEWFYKGFNEIVGVDENKLFISGNPKFDDVVGCDFSLYKDEIHEYIGLKNNQKYCLFSPASIAGLRRNQNIDDQTISLMLKNICEAILENNENIKIVIKPHPTDFEYNCSDNIFNLYDQALSAIDKDKYLIVKDSKYFHNKGPSLLHKLIALAEFTVINISTVGLESLALNTPVVSIVLPECYCLTDALGDQKTYFNVICPAKDIKNKVKDPFEKIKNSVFTEDDFVKAREKLLFQLDGKASERIVSEINNILDLTIQKTKKRETATRKNKSLKILQVVHNFPPYSFAGTELYTLNLSRKLIESGHDVTILYPHYDLAKEMYSVEEKEYKGIKLLEINTLIKCISECVENKYIEGVFRAVLKKNKFDLIHFQHVIGLSASLLRIASISVPTIMTLHDFWFICDEGLLTKQNGSVCVGPDSVFKCIACRSTSMNAVGVENSTYFDFRKKILQKMINYPNVVITVSEFAKNKLLNYGIDRPIVVSPAGIKEPELLIEGTGLRDKKVQFVFLGSLIPRKGAHILLEAWQQINSSNAKLKLYGFCADKVYSEQILCNISKLENVNYEGAFMPLDLAKILSGADVVVIPSTGENYPLIIQEAFSANVPVVASRVSGVPEIVHNGKNGFLFEPENTRELAKKIEKIVRKPKLIDKFSSNIKKRKVTKTIEDNCLELDKIYFEIRGKKRKIDRKIETTIIIPLLNKEYSYNYLSKVFSALSFDSCEVIEAVVDNFDAHLIAVWNEIAKKARGKNLIFVSPNVFLRPKWCENLEKRIDKDRCGLVYSKIVNEKNQAEGIGVVFDENKIPYLFAKNLPENSAMSNFTACFQAASDGVVLVKKDDFLSLGGFDENFQTVLFSVMDFSFKLRERQKRIVYANDSVVAVASGMQAMFSKHDLERFIGKWKDRIVSDAKDMYLKFGYLFEDGKIFKIDDLLKTANELKEKKEYNSAIAIYSKIIKEKLIKEAILSLQEVFTATGNHEKAAKVAALLRRV